jgi:hypothetical protein
MFDRSTNLITKSSPRLTFTDIGDTTSLVAVEVVLL